MNILATIRREERRLEKRLGRLQLELAGLKARREEESSVSGRKGKDFRSREETMGENQSGGKEGGELEIARLVKWSRTPRL